jgi:hypothetical protein
MCYSISLGFISLIKGQMISSLFLIILYIMPFAYEWLSCDTRLWWGLSSDTRVILPWQIAYQNQPNTHILVKP